MSLSLLASTGTLKVEERAEGNFQALSVEEITRPIRFLLMALLDTGHFSLTIPRLFQGNCTLQLRQS